MSVFAVDISLSSLLGSSGIGNAAGISRAVHLKRIPGRSGTATHFYLIEKNRCPRQWKQKLPLLLKS